MATQYIKFKRSSIPGKRPSNSQMELGELALNTSDGRIFTKKENVGVGTTITLLNVWTENVGGGAYYNDGAVGIGTTNPTKRLHILDTDCDIKIGDVTEGTPTTDGGIIFSGLGTFTSGIFTEVDGEILSYGINVGQITGIETGRVGGIFRLDTRNPGGTGDSNCFVVKGRSIGTTIAHNSIIINLNDGNTFLSPSKGVVVVGALVTTGTASQNLQVTGGAYVSGNLGIGTTNPTSRLTVQGDVSISGVVTATSFTGSGANLTTINASNISSGTIDDARLPDLITSNINITSGVSTFSTVKATTFEGSLAGTALTTTNIPNLTGAITSVNTTTALGSFTSANLAAALTDETGSGSAVFATSPTLVTPILGSASATSINASGIITATTFNGNINAGIGTITNLSGTNVSYNGIGTVGSLNIGSTQVISSGRQLQNIASLDATTTATIETAIANAPNTFTDLQVTGLSTFTNGPVLIGTGTSTGTALQRLQVTGGAYISDNTGIGTTNPLARLTVQGDVSIASTVSIGSSIDIIPYDNLGTLSFEGSAGQLFSITNNLTSGSIFSVNDVSGIPSIDVDADGTVQIATYGGNLGVGTTNPTSKLTVQGDVLVSGVITSTDYNSASDINLKENIQPIENPIDKVLQINGVSFDWKEDGRSSMGVIAQEVERVLPELVSGSDTKTVNYNGLIGLLIEVVKDQQKEINMLKESMKRL